MNTNWFLGANTAEGFFSRFDQLHPGIRIRKNVIIKGGPGCGKSTFMKTLRGCAEALGADTESYLCSSDPASLDGLFIPALGLAFVDGTAPWRLWTVPPPTRMQPNKKTGADRACFYASVSSLAASRPLLCRLQMALYTISPRALSASVTANTATACQ